MIWLHFFNEASRFSDSWYHVHRSNHETDTGWCWGRVYSDQKCCAVSQTATRADIVGQHKQAVNETDQTLCNVIIRKARVCETALKVLQSANKTDRSTSDDISAVLYTQVSICRASTLHWLYRLLLTLQSSGSCALCHEMCWFPSSQRRWKTSEVLQPPLPPADRSMADVMVEVVVTVEDVTYFHSRSRGGFPAAGPSDDATIPREQEGRP